MAYNYCISVDWFEVCCYGAPIEEGDRVVNGMEYHIIDEKKSTRVFKRLMRVTFRGLDYFYIQQQPIWYVWNLIDSIKTMKDVSYLYLKCYSE